MKFDWDPAKAESNVRKHGVRFADAVTALEDELALTMRDPFAEGEERWVTLGVDSLGRALGCLHLAGRLDPGHLGPESDAQ